MSIVSEAKRCIYLIKFNIHNDNLTFKISIDGAPIYINLCNLRREVTARDTINETTQDVGTLVGCNRGTPL